MNDDGDDDYDYDGSSDDGCGGDYDAGGGMVSNGSNYKGLLCSH